MYVNMLLCRIIGYTPVSLKRYFDDDRNNQFIVATAIPVHQQMPPISNGGFRSHHYQSQNLQAHSFPELSKARDTVGQKGTTRPSYTTLEFMEISRPSKLPVASRFPAMDSGRNSENSARGTNIDNPYASLNNRVSFVRIPNQKSGTMTDPQGTPNTQSSLVESHRPVTHPALEKSSLTKRFSVPEKLNAVQERPQYNNVRIPYQEVCHSTVRKGTIQFNELKNVAQKSRS